MSTYYHPQTLKRQLSFAEHLTLTKRFTGLKRPLPVVLKTRENPVSWLTLNLKRLFTLFMLLKPIVALRDF